MYCVISGTTNSGEQPIRVRVLAELQVYILISTKYSIKGCVSHILLYDVTVYQLERVIAIRLFTFSLEYECVLTFILVYYALIHVHVCIALQKPHILWYVCVLAV